jgi:hypothetical protein
MNFTEGKLLDFELQVDLSGSVKAEKNFPFSPISH